MFNDADDPLRQIDGSTLKVETVRWLKFRTWVHQTVSVTVGTHGAVQHQGQRVLFTGPPDRQSRDRSDRTGALLQRALGR